MRDFAGNSCQKHTETSGKTQAMKPEIAVSSRCGRKTGNFGRAVRFTKPGDRLDFDAAYA